MSSGCGGLAPARWTAHPSVGERLWLEGFRLVVPGFKEPHNWVQALPFMWASATTRHDRARLLFPDIEIHDPGQLPTPHQHIHQFIGAWGKSAFARRPEKITEMVDTVRLAMLGRQSGLVITHQDTEHAFTGIPNTKVLHHGNVAGDDDFRAVEALFVIGGPFAPPGAIAKIASAEARCRVPYATPVRTPCVGLMEAGHGVALERQAYADPRLQAVHAGIYDSGIIQAIGRARGLRRTAANPVDVYLYANLPLPVPIASIDIYRQPSRLERMFLADGVPVNAADMHREYPGKPMFPSEAAAAKARERWGGRAGMQAQVRDLAQRAGVAWDILTWQPKAKGHKGRVRFLPHAQLAAFAAEVIREFGGYVIFQAEPLYRPPVWQEDIDIGGKRDLFLPMSESSRKRPSPRPGRISWAPPRAPPYQGELL